MKIRCLTALFIIIIFTSFKTGNVTNVSKHNIINNNTRKEKKAKKKSLKICVISDLNSSYGSTTYSPEVSAVINELSEIKPDIILCAGDMVAGQKATLTEENIVNMWAGFKSTVLTPISNLKIPFGFTVGNHDASPTYLKDRDLAKQFWLENKSLVNLKFVDSTNYPFYFSYTEKNVFFISWDASGPVITPEVFSWMKSQLQSKAAKEASLRILVGHLPLYAIVEHKNRPGEVITAADSAFSFFKNNGIDIYVSGHQHAYYPAKKLGITLFNTGAIGNGPRAILGHTEEPQKAYAIIEVPLKSPKKFKLKALRPVSNTEIDIKSLPDSVVGFNGISRRYDKVRD